LLKKINKHIIEYQTSNTTQVADGLKTAKQSGSKQTQNRFVGVVDKNLI